MDLIGLRNKQKEFFKSSKTMSYNFRIEQLKKLKTMLIKYEKDFIDALYQDMQKCEFEAIASEFYMVIEEINLFIKNLRKWMHHKKVKKNMITMDAKTMVINKPFGVSLIISPWNYPVQLTFLPLVGAIGAGNTAIIAPSQLTPKVYDVIYDSIKNTFDEEYIAVIDKTVPPESTTTIEYDKIFFTGSPRVGKIIMSNASKFLTSVTLELGGKSPVIIDDINGNNFNKAVKRIIWGKFLNSGQTCISPDYILLREDLKEKFLTAFSKEIEVFNKERKLHRIINENHYKRIKSYLNDGKIIYGGEYDDNNLSISISLVEPKDLETNIIKDEIFGSVFPILYYKTKEEARELVEKICSTPLAMYIFSEDLAFNYYFIEKISYGCCAVNDTISQILNPHAPFGGIANSGIGQYHGYDSFKCFSKETTILNKGYNFELTTKYPPYDKNIKSLKFLYNLIKK
ncbi:aldehyde dehydrogenase family protein [uncultured Brachyspira sp.]|uniref:aldehyde dehydrogenase family protein n=1 Tax=uncultured Brachyspira sp. TaxID=221953 RepID=UPI0026104D29|nr:aldehyde dehydrogenase family protein [uncultured Brachyspira sp.]